MAEHSRRPRKRRSDNEATAEELAEMIRSQAGTVAQSDIPPHFDVYATMEAAWLDVVERYLQGAPPLVLQDAKFIFYNGVRAAAALCIYCEGQDKFNAAADQINSEVLAYDKEAREVVRARTLDPDDINGVPIMD